MLNHYGLLSLEIDCSEEVPAGGQLCSRYRLYILANFHKRLGREVALRNRLFSLWYNFPDTLL